MTLSDWELKKRAFELAREKLAAERKKELDERNAKIISGLKEFQAAQEESTLSAHEAAEAMKKMGWALEKARQDEALKAITEWEGRIDEIIAAGGMTSAVDTGEVLTKEKLMEGIKRAKAAINAATGPATLRGHDGNLVPVDDVKPAPLPSHYGEW